MKVGRIDDDSDPLRGGGFASIPLQSSESALLITLDSCRYDTFAAADVPNLRRIGQLHRAMAPGNFTYASHSAMFVGFTPGVAQQAEPFVNPKFAKVFKIAGIGFPSKGQEQFTLAGRSIIDGFNRVGYTTVGTGAAGWFNPLTSTGQNLCQDFQHYLFAGNTWSLGRQMQWLAETLAGVRGPVFCFLNVGETHTPYYFDGAPWSVDDNPCVPFGEHNNADECRRRQRMCLEFADALLAPLLAAFEHSTTMVCGDHGDCWGEDGLWEHGISHPKVLEVPLLLRVPPRTSAAAA